MPIAANDPLKMSAVAQGFNRFGLDLYRELVVKAPKDRAANRCVSPISISMTLAMVHLGARGATAELLGKSLGFPSDLAHADVGHLRAQLSGGGAPPERYGERAEPHTLEIANSLWVTKTHPPLASFVEAATQDFASHIGTMDVNTPNDAATAINDWTKEKTRGRITDLVSPAAITPLTRIVAVNAVYLKAAWVHAFQSAATRPEAFTTGAGRKIQTPTMHLDRMLRYAKTKDGTQVVELPYVSATESQLAMLLVLPSSTSSLDKLERALTTERLESWSSSLEPQQVAVAVPKFRLEWNASLNDALNAVGLGPLFTAPDLSGMSDVEELRVDQMVHKTFIEVDEKGTEAAAATAAMMGATGMPQEPVAFRADRPFLFFIRDGKTGSLLFLGRVDDPS